MLYQHGSNGFTHFGEEFETIHNNCMRQSLRANDVVRKPKTFQVLFYRCLVKSFVQESAKSQKTVESMIISRPGDDKKGGKKKEDAKKVKKTEEVAAHLWVYSEVLIVSVVHVYVMPSRDSADSGSDVGSCPSSPKGGSDDLAKKRDAFFKKMQGGGAKKNATK